MVKVQLARNAQTIPNLFGAGPLSRQVTIGNIPDEVLLNIFCYYLDASPQCWPKLVHVCRKWRHIVYSSPRSLHLRLYCTHGTPVLKSLDYWPPLPIVVQYGRFLMPNPPAPEDEDNIMAALRHTDRVVSINLTVTSSLLEKMGTIAEPFSELEDLVLLSQTLWGWRFPGPVPSSGPRVYVVSTQSGLPFPHSQSFFRLPRILYIFNFTKFRVLDIFRRKRSPIPCLG